MCRRYTALVAGKPKSIRSYIADMTEKVISVYDADDAETIVNGIEATDADTHGEAVAELAAAYTGWRATDSDDDG